MADWFSDFSSSLTSDPANLGDLSLSNMGSSGGDGGGSFMNLDASPQAMYGMSDADWSALYTLDATGGGGGTAAPASGTSSGGIGDTLMGFLQQAGQGITGMLESLASGAKTLFTNAPGATETRLGPDGKPVTTTLPAGSLNDLGKQLLAGAITSIGSASMMKWQEERKSKEAAKVRKFQAGESQKERDFKAEQQAEKYRRAAYGQAPQLTAQRGLLGGG